MLRTYLLGTTTIAAMLFAIIAATGPVATDQSTSGTAARAAIPVNHPSDDRLAALAGNEDLEPISLQAPRSSAIR